MLCLVYFLTHHVVNSVDRRIDSIADDGERAAVAPIVALAMTTAMLATSSPRSTRRTAAERSRALLPDMACKLVIRADLVNVAGTGAACCAPT